MFDSGLITDVELEETLLRWWVRAGHGCVELLLLLMRIIRDEDH